MTRKKRCKSEFRSSAQPTNGGCPPPRQINIEYTPPSNVRKYDGADRQADGRTDGHEPDARTLSPSRGRRNGPITIAIRARFEYDSSTIRLQHATTRYEVFVRSHTRWIRALHENQW